MLDYIASFIVSHRPFTQNAGSVRYSPRLEMFSSDLTQEAILQCTSTDDNGQGFLCVVRMSCHTNLCDEFVRRFRYIRDVHGLQNRCTIMLCAGRQSLNSQLETQFRNRMGQWLGGHSKMTRVE